MSAWKKPQNSGEFRIERPSNEDAARLVRLRPYVRQTGDSWRDPWFIEERRLLDYLLVYIVQGKGTFSIAGKRFEVDRDDIIWIPPDTLHEMRGTSPRMHCLYAHFDLLYDPERSHWDAVVPGGTRDLGDWRALMHPTLGDAVIDSWCGKLRIGNKSAVRDLLERICVEHLHYSESVAVLLSGLMLQTVAELLRGSNAGVSLRPVHWERMQSALGSIRNNLLTPICVEKCATDAGFSASHFRKVFREVHGLSARSARRNAVMQKARELLVYTDLTISAISDRLGFSTVHNFSRAFRSIAGTSPRQYRHGFMRR